MGGMNRPQDPRRVRGVEEGKEGGISGGGGGQSGRPRRGLSDPIHAWHPCLPCVPCAQATAVVILRVRVGLASRFGKPQMHEFQVHALLGPIGPLLSTWYRAPVARGQGTQCWSSWGVPKQYQCWDLHPRFPKKVTQVPVINQCASHGI